MLEPGGDLLTNDKPPDKAPAGLEASSPAVLAVARDSDLTEYLCCYERIN